METLDRVLVRVTEDELGYPVVVGGQPVEFLQCERRQRTGETVYLCASRAAGARVDLVLFRQTNGVWGRIVR
ncbi:MAG: hypothetical protein ACYCW6_17215 [Candidatus Xenobia bacterium]